MDAAQNAITISCHCGAARQTLIPKGDSDHLFSQLALCHCDTCRHMTGLLCTSYAPIPSRPLPSLAGLESYATSSTSTWYFCSTCGCHVFHARHASSSTSPEEWDWKVATGVITDAPESNLPKQWRHEFVEDTKDGGLSPWFPGIDSSSQPSEPSPSENNSNTLPASCQCTSVSLLTTRPSLDPSLKPDSPYPDLLLPYCSTPSVTISNPSHEKWYLRPGPSPSPAAGNIKPDPSQQQVKYLAGTCACPTCRLTSGFEIQTWAFVPRRNILISAGPNNNPQPLDFTNLPPGIPLKQYESSPGRMREFCSRCGATVFWHDKFRPELIDVSVGLLRAAEGSRAGSWLEWWTGRVSFSEEAGKGRVRGAKVWGEGVIKALEEGMVMGGQR